MKTKVSALTLPMVHSSGLFTMLAFLRFGVPFVLCERFDPNALLDAMERHRCTWLAGLPFMFTALLQSQREHPRNVDLLRRSGPIGATTIGAATPKRSQNRVCSMQPA